MKQTKGKKGIAVKVSALLLVLCMLCSCSSAAGTVISVTPSVTTRNVISFSGEEPEKLHYSSGKDAFTENVASSGLIKLVIDKETCSFGIYDTAGGSLWTALPLLEDCKTDKGFSSGASMISLRIAGGTDVYELNSQDNALAFGKAKIETKDGNAVFTYDMFPDRATAEKKVYGKTDIGFRAVMTVKLIDGNMSVSCKFKNLTGNKSAFIESASLLDYFGAYNDTDSGNFIFVPDGCGAIINTSIYDESFKSLSFSVYGNDPSTAEKTSGTAVIPTFGIKHGSCAFAALIEEGDALSVIRAEKATDASEMNRAYASFSITPVDYSDKKLYVSQKSALITKDKYGNETDGIKICYRFLSGKNATYAGLASAVREQLIRNRVLSSGTLTESDYLPFFLTVSGSVKKSFSFINYPSVLTNFDQAKDMLVRMKNKGINNVNIRYTDIFTGGQDSIDIKKSVINRSLGGTKGLKELYSYVSEQKMGLYLDTDILSSAKPFKASAESINSAPSLYEPYDALADKMGTELKKRYLRNINKLSSTMSSLLAQTKNYAFSGFCLGDAGSLLYSDFSTDGVLRQEAADIIAASVLPLSSSRKIMVDTGNFSILKNVDCVINIPTETTVSKSGAYKPIPFIQLVLHGIVDYAGMPVNTVNNPAQTILKFVEYGSCPHYEWNYEELSGESDRYYYDNTINDAVACYQRANEALGDLRSARITDHYEIDDGVFCTEYDTGAMIYVNYTDRAYEILGVTVEPRDFLRIN